MLLLLRGLPFAVLMVLSGCAASDLRPDSQVPDKPKPACTSCAFKRAINQSIDQFDLGLPVKLPKPLAEDLRQRTYLVETTKGKYVIKIRQKDAGDSESAQDLQKAKKQNGQPFLETPDFIVTIFDYAVAI